MNNIDHSINNIDHGGIIESVDDTLSEIGSVTVKLIKTIHRGNVWIVQLHFDYKSKKIIDYTSPGKDSKEINPYFGAKLLENFLNVNPLFIKFDNVGSEVLNSSSKAEFPNNGRKGLSFSRGDTHIWEGTAYVPKENSWYRDAHLESKL